MKGRKFISGIAAVLATGIAIAGMPLNTLAEQVRNNDRVEGVIHNSSPIYRFMNMWTPGSPMQELHGQEYTFRAEQGDEIRVNLERGWNGGAAPVFVLFHQDTNKQLAYSQSNSFNYRIPRSGDYKLLVLAKDSTNPSRYALSISGLSGEGGVGRSPGRRRDRGGYDQERVLRDDFGLQPIECSVRRSLVRITFRQDDRDSTYCAKPNRNVSAGDYFYNPDTRNLEGNGNQQQQGCRAYVGGVCVNR